MRGVAYALVASGLAYAGLILLVVLVSSVDPWLIVAVVFGAVLAL